MSEDTVTFDAQAEQEILESFSEEMIHADYDYDVDLRKYYHDTLKLFTDVAGFKGVVSKSSAMGDPMSGTKIVIEDTEWFIAPGLAVRTSFQKHDSTTRPDGDFLVTEVFKRIDGQWYVVRAHFTHLR